MLFIMNISDINYQEQCVYIWHSQKEGAFNISLKLWKLPVEGLVCSWKLKFFTYMALKWGYFHIYNVLFIF